MSNDFYVYIYWRLDTNDIFYVGKGKGDRWKVLYNRKRHFKNIINKHLIVCEIIKNNLTEQEAFYWEERIIETLVFEYGYSIDIPNNRSKEKGMHLVNCTWGGDGTSGMNPFEMVDEEKKEVWKSKISENHAWKGKKRPEHSEKMKGKNNPWYGKCLSSEHKNKIGEANKGRYLGKNSPRAKSVICITTLKIFYSTTEGAKYYNCQQSHVSQCCRGKRNYCGKLPDGTPLVWRYLVWNHNKKYRILTHY